MVPSQQGVHLAYCGRKWDFWEGIAVKLMTAIAEQNENAGASVGHTTNSCTPLLAVQGSSETFYQVSTLYHTISHPLLTDQLAIFRLIGVVCRYAARLRFRSVLHWVIIWPDTFCKNAHLPSTVGQGWTPCCDGTCSLSASLRQPYPAPPQIVWCSNIFHRTIWQLPQKALILGLGYCRIDVRQLHPLCVSYWKDRRI